MARTPSYNVSYLDAVNGGSGLTRVPVAQLHTWLKDHPGVLIRRLDPDWLSHNELQVTTTLKETP